MSTSARMLQLLALLQTHRYWPGAELAARLEVSPRTLRRDVDRLRELGYPVEAERGVGGGYQLRGGADMPPLLLDDEEAVAIAVGLATAAGGSVAGLQESSVRALSKVVQLMPPRLRRRVNALQASTVPTPLGGPTVDADTLTVLAQACRDDERLRFTYTPRSRDPAERHVEPHRLVSLGRRWYLIAYDLDRHDWRTFRVDRLTDPHPTGARFRQRQLPGDDPVAFVQRSISSTPTAYAVEVVVQAPAAVVEGVVHQWGEVEPLGDDACRLRMGVDHLEWPAMVLGAVGAPFTVVGPPELVAYLRDVGERFLAATSG